MWRWEPDEPEGFTSITGPNTRIVIDLKSVEAILYDKKSDELSFLLTGGARLTSPEVKKADRDQIEQQWMKARRK